MRNHRRMTQNRRRFLQQLGVGAAGVGLISFLPACRTLQSTVAGSKLPRSTPEAEGVSSAKLLEFLERVCSPAQEEHEMHSFMLVRHGKVVAEGWWSPYGPQLNHTMYSMSKSFTSSAVGFAVTEGKLRVDDKVVSFFPDELPEKVSDFLAALRIKDLLTMSAGHGKEPTSEMVKSDNWVKTFLSWPIDNPPGSTFLYNSGATYMCSAIVQKVTGQKVVDYLTPRLFEPLGIEGMTWETCPRGINVGGWGLNIRTEGLAKFGQMYLQKGLWNGRRVLPSKWVEEATTFKIQQPPPANPTRPKEQNDWQQGYCYQFWRSQHNAFRGDGAFGQYTIVMPEQDAVLAITSESKNMQGQLDLVWKYFLPAMQEKPLAVDRAAQRQLHERLASLALRIPTGYWPPGSRDSGSHAQFELNETWPNLARRISGKVFKLENNELGLQSISFGFRNNGCTLTLKDSQAEYPIACGMERWERGETNLPGTPPRLVSGGAAKPGTKAKIMSSGRWKDNKTFEVRMQYYETPHHDTLTFRFEGDKVQIAFMNSIAAMTATPKDKRGVLEGRI